ncbi:hypothetical protein HQ346_11345 [Rhodococcus sp. BP-252]|uniref:Rv1733c family protein n=1 Tax=unclassified Rhodococcus (in: high G+C Gram-positive bacteria) TaxID=192944 RepID=UPI001431ED03|nr:MULTISPECIES: hypothetical protein [unclassified Rhodococcus (in: high G+C Gram-positive bacteria)]MBY6417161.1 hypothetical protein [Rhodococcus sp. BP-321]MBY6427185.1 hypothetical protein [Rhodococcus sp. BP-323]MBY6432202.1 hypothetical protein [Rhodococcus sp. BP-322]MBY6441159.1 hypothetical protein [Rhodococcus sp. BP-319]MBY6446299.1 hypothetical protein [Rhodococcus sp. BP-318]MBY6451098.1 hypothetical protein [Rhodococcus sp. BP-315]MBY6455726.1 hypothetical protein [Rhodococcus
MRRKHTDHARNSGVGYPALHNPLFRRSDRIQARVKNVVVTLVILMVPIAAWLGMSTLETQQARMVAQETSLHQVTATTTAEAQAMPLATGDGGSSTTASVDATWTFDGAQHNGSVSVASGSPAGTESEIWVDAAGERTAQPTTGADAVAAALFVGIGSLFAVAMILSGVYTVVRYRLDQQRDSEWDVAIKNFLNENSPS